MQDSLLHIEKFLKNEIIIAFSFLSSSRISIATHWHSDRKVGNATLSHSGTTSGKPSLTGGKRETMYHLILLLFVYVFVSFSSSEE